MKTLVAAAMLLASITSAPAAPTPAKKWFMTVDIYWNDNRGKIYWDRPDTLHLKRAFDTRGECLARWRTFRKECRGLIADNNVHEYSVAKFTGFCRRHPQQPEPVLEAPNFKRPSEGAEEEKACAE